MHCAGSCEPRRSSACLSSRGLVCTWGQGSTAGRINAGSPESVLAICIIFLMNVLLWIYQTSSQKVMGAGLFEYLLADVVPDERTILLSKCSSPKRVLPGMQALLRVPVNLDCRKQSRHGGHSGKLLLPWEWTMLTALDGWPQWVIRIIQKHRRKAKWDGRGEGEGEGGGGGGGCSITDLRAVCSRSWGIQLFCWRRDGNVKPGKSRAQGISGYSLTCFIRCSSSGS